MPRSAARLLPVLALVLVAAACSERAATVPPPADMMAPPVAGPSLYDRLGGQAAIGAVVDLFLANVAADPVIAPAFAKTDLKRLRTLLVEQVCAASGGPCTYTGKDMLTAHKGQNVTVEQFNAMGGDMARALDKAGVPAQEKSEVLALLGSMQGDIVGH